MKTPRCKIVFGLALLATAIAARAEDYTWTNTATGTWAGATNWTPNSEPTGPTSADNVYVLTGITGSPTTTLSSGTTSVNNIVRSGTGVTWLLGGGGGASLSILNAASISQTAATTTIIRNLSVGGLEILTSNLSVSAGSLFFGATSNGSGQPISGLNVSGTTTVSGGSLLMNVQNANSNTYSLGLLNVSGAGVVTLANRPKSGSTSGTATVSGLAGAGGAIQADTGHASNSNSSQDATLVINNSEDFSSGTVLRNSAIATNAGVLSVVKSGTGRQILTGTNSFSGGLTVKEGTLVFTGSNFFTGGTTIEGGTLSMGNGGSTGNILGDIALSGTTARFMINRSNAGTFAGVISGTGSLVKAGNGNWDVTGNNTYTGDTIIQGGQLRISSDQNLGNVSNNVIFDNGSATAQWVFTQSVTSNRNIIINGDVARLSTEDANTADEFPNITTLNGTISGTGGVDKRFVGTLILTSPNTYQGGTVITTGMLVAQNAVGSATGTGEVTVGVNGTLAGSGIIAPAEGNFVSVLGTISPGFNSAESLIFNLAGDSQVIFQFGSKLNLSLGTDSDSIVFSSLGDWLGGTGTAVLNLTLDEGFSYASSYRIFDNVTTEGFTLANITGYDENLYTPSFTKVGNGYELSFTAIPEPSTWMLLGLGSVAILGLRWHSRRSTR